MLRVLPILLALGVLVYAFIDCLTTDEKKVRNLSKVLWVLILLLSSPIPFLGPIGWFVAGRPKREYAGGSMGFGGRNRGRQPAPDDDPEFLASLNKDDRKPSDTPSSDNDEDEMLKRWEEDLKHREDDLRSPDQDNPDGRTKDKD
ncbi:PLD nuclease N-terminal domain-containing protein [Embleya sp. NBC_00896]|uniref:PLD nuclease N-terminal domain-containing protein n=1 Tax=Embleya sp. NBC_00896 TaxID=2975961 RepID=UPI00386C219C|nr:PLD nuclease N-terminal domain-containing protein [Embleya sp. NBC_00896]